MAKGGPHCARKVLDDVVVDARDGDEMKADAEGSDWEIKINEWDAQGGDAVIDIAISSHFGRICYEQVYCEEIGKNVAQSKQSIRWLQDI